MVLCQSHHKKIEYGDQGVLAQFRMKADFEIKKLGVILDERWTGNAQKIRELFKRKNSSIAIRFKNNLVAKGQGSGHGLSKRDRIFASYPLPLDQAVYNKIDSIIQKRNHETGRLAKGQRTWARLIKKEGGKAFWMKHRNKRPKHVVRQKSKRLGGIPLQQCARRLKIDRPLFYGVLIAYGVKPQGGTSKAGKFARMLTPEQFSDVRRRLVAAGYRIT